MTRIEKASCGRMDHGGCGLLVRVENGRVTGVKGDPDAPTRGYTCAKARAYPERLYHPDRLLYPQRRLGNRGDNRWERVSWDDALGTIAERLSDCRKRLVPERVLFMQGTPKGLENLLLYRFAHSFGSPNVAATGTVCFAPRLGASLLTAGFYPHPDLAHPPELVLLWGANHPATSADGVLAPELQEALRRGSRLVRIDPAGRKIAPQAQKWLRVRPGRDLLLALAMIKVIIEEGLFDREFVERWTVGFDELRTHVESASLSALAEETWLAANDIRAAARMYAEAGSAALVWGNAVDHTASSVQTARALVILMALTGNLDRAGGNVQADPPATVRPRDFMLMGKYEGMRDRMIGKEFKLAAMLGFVPYHVVAREILAKEPAAVEAVYLQGTNPLVSCPNAPEIGAALQRVGFLAVSELFPTPTAHLADILLPAATHFEFDDLGYFGLPFGRMMLRRKIVDPPGECRSDVWIINQLARRLKLEDPFWNDEAECIDFILGAGGPAPRHVPEGGLLAGRTGYRKYETKGFPTKSGKVELVSTWMEKNGYSPLPPLTAPPDETGPGMDLTFTSAKIPEFFHSMNRNLPGLRRAHPDPLLRLHPETARGIGAAEGDWVWVENTRGRVRARAKLADDLDPRVVMGEHAWWFPERGPETRYGSMDANINVLTGSGPPYEPSIGSVNLRGFRCRVYPVAP